VDPLNPITTELQPGMAEALNNWICATAGLGPYSTFIVACYILTFGVCVTLILYAMLDEQAQQRAVAKLEAQGIRRRSAARPTETSAP
jgi:heme exporter protein D